jgi:hypothetical protein
VRDTARASRSGARTRSHIHAKSAPSRPARTSGLLADALQALERAPLLLRQHQLILRRRRHADRVLRRKARASNEARKRAHNQR